MNLRKRFAMLPEAGVTENHFMTRAEMTAGVGCAASVSTLAAVVGPHGVARVRHGSDEGTPAWRRHQRGGFGGPRGRRSLAGPGDGHDEPPLAVCGTPRGSRARKVTTGEGVNGFVAGVAPSTSGKQLLSGRGTPRCQAARVRCGIVGCTTDKPLSRASRGCVRNLTIRPSAASVTPVERGVVGPIGASGTGVRCGHVATVWGWR
jgi:hypothetical protein